MTAKTEYDRTKSENALWRANIGAPKTGGGTIAKAAEDAYWKAKDAGATTQAATEAARSAFEAARLAMFGGAPIPTAKEIARELADAKNEEAEKRAAERLEAARSKYGVGQATTASDNGTASHAADDTAEAALWPASTPTPAASAKPKDTPTEPTEKAPSPAKMATATAKAPTLAKADEAYLLAEHEDDAGNGDTMVKRYGAHFAYTGALGWLQYVGTHYEAEGAEAAVYLAAEETLRARSAAAIAAGKRYNGLLREATPTDRKITAAAKNFGKKRTLVEASFDDERHLLNCANGVLNLKSGKLEAHDASQLFTYCLATEYDASASRDEVLAFLRGSVKGGDVDEVLTWLQTWLGYCLTGETNLDEFLYIHGPPRAGKGTLAGAMRALLSKRLSAEISFSTLTSKRDGDTDNFDLAPLRAARLLTCEEGNARDFLNSALVKKMTGGNALRTSFKGRDAFEYYPQFKLVSVSNFPIRADADDGGLWARVRVLEFPFSHVGEENYNLREHMQRPEALRGWLAWLAEGAKRYYEFKRRNKGIPTPASVMASTAAARADLDTLGQWLEERTIKKADAWIPYDLTHADYAAWCAKNGAEPKLMKSFTATLRTKGFEVGKLDRHAGEVKRGIVGLALKA